MGRYYVTFGSSQLKNFDLPEKPDKIIVGIIAETYEKARQKIFKSSIGSHFCTTYTEEALKSAFDKNTLKSFTFIDFEDLLKMEIVEKPKRQLEVKDLFNPEKNIEIQKLEIIDKLGDFFEEIYSGNLHRDVNEFKKMVDNYFDNVVCFYKGDNPHNDSNVLHWYIENCTDESEVEELDEALDQWFAPSLIDLRFRFTPKEPEELEKVYKWYTVYSDEAAFCGKIYASISDSKLRLVYLSELEEDMKNRIRKNWKEYNV